MKYIGRDFLLKPVSLDELSDVDLSGLASGDLLSFDGTSFVSLTTGSGGGLDADLLDGLEASAFATAAQGSLADTALQPGETASDLASLPATSNQVLTADGAGGVSFADLPDEVIQLLAERVLSIAANTSDSGFFVSANGITIRAPLANVGDSEYINGNTYTKIDSKPSTSNAPTSATSGVQNMAGWFNNESSFDGDISHWDTSAADTMQEMFRNASDFNQDISAWDVGTVTNMIGTFSNAESFNQDISTWDTSNVQDMDSMFAGATNFNQPLNGWDLSGISSNGGFNYMFQGATSFNQPLNGWDLSVLPENTYSSYFERMFYNATSFNGDISNWDVSKESGYSSFYGMFQGASSFNIDISSWDVSNAEGFRYMFQDATSFNQPIGSWDVSNAGDFRYMFKGASSFNQPLGTWDVSNAFSMAEMFKNATAFNYNIFNDWTFNPDADLSEIINGTALFDSIDWPNFSPPVTIKGLLKNNPTFNEDVTGWDTSQVVNMGEVFVDCTNFSYNIFEHWDFSSATNISGILTGTAALTSIDWSTFTFPPTLSTISGLFYIPPGADTTFNGDVSGLDVSGYQDLSYMFYSFFGYSSFNQPLNDWDVSSATDMLGMFDGASSFNQPLNNWNTSNVTRMLFMFSGASAFNGDISSWDTGNVENMRSMFSGASAFNQDISSWDTGNVQSMESMFQNASSFNQDISSWDTSNVTQFYGMFQNASAFDQDISAWDFSSSSGWGAVNYMLSGTGSATPSGQYSTANYDALLIRWQEQANSGLWPGGTGYVELGQVNANYTLGGAAEAARTDLVNNHGWYIQDLGGV